MCSISENKRRRSTPIWGVSGPAKDDPSPPIPGENPPSSPCRWATVPGDMDGSRRGAAGPRTSSLEDVWNSPSYHHYEGESLVFYSVIHRRHVGRVWRNPFAVTRHRTANGFFPVSLKKGDSDVQLSVNQLKYWKVEVDRLIDLVEMQNICIILFYVNSSQHWYWVPASH